MKNLLRSSRYLLIIPVIGSLLLTLGIVVMGIGRIVDSTIGIILKGNFSAKAAKLMSTAVIETIDLFLVGTVAYITAIGLYKLFISKEEIKLPIQLNIKTLKNLEDKIIGVIVAALAVAFLGAVANSDDKSGILYYGGGIAIVIVALAVFMWLTDKSEAEKNKKPDKEED
jgi:uncharacterized membrane protein YqhA